MKRSKIWGGQPVTDVRVRGAIKSISTHRLACDEYFMSEVSTCTFFTRVLRIFTVFTGLRTYEVILPDF